MLNYASINERGDSVSWSGSNSLPRLAKTVSALGDHVLSDRLRIAFRAELAVLIDVRSAVATFVHHRRRLGGDDSLFYALDDCGHV